MATMQTTLEAMQAGILERKNVAGLTPVAGELGGPPRVVPIAGPIPADFPFDMPLDAARMALIEVRRGTTMIEEGCLAVETALGLVPGGSSVVAATKAEVKAAAERTKEANSQALFEADFARKAAAAQAEAFEAPESPFNSLPHEVPKPQTLPVWVCPTHKKSNAKTSPKGRRFMVCPTCDEFER